MRWGASKKNNRKGSQLERKTLKKSVNKEAKLKGKKKKGFQGDESNQPYETDQKREEPGGQTKLARAGAEEHSGQEPRGG